MAKHRWIEITSFQHNSEYFWADIQRNRTNIEQDFNISFRDLTESQNEKHKKSCNRVVYLRNCTQHLKCKIMFNRVGSLDFQPTCEKKENKSKNFKFHKFFALCSKKNVSLFKFFQTKTKSFKNPWKQLEARNFWRQTRSSAK